ncbi:hypothetical protein [Cytobacillus horneckiae]|uniref:hypothetical protein n=1 Tax=Cytobacillus horneckiae TaxID=549687 RepID=UPI000A7E284E|nr:hypothetical protein [Cytobacillus horneckiae]
MNLSERANWAEIKFRILEAAMNLENGESKDYVISKLMEVVEILDNTEPNGGVND